jgi:hypothetical protein
LGATKRKKKFGYINSPEARKKLSKSKKGKNCYRNGKIMEGENK